jgi:pentatricopeptide repeat protein
MWARAEGTGIILGNATGRCATKHCYFCGVLNACASTVALEEGRCAHEQIIQSGLESDVFVGSSSVDMYAKCGSMEDAWSMFNKMPSQNVVTWTAILGGCAMHGCGKEALKHFERMCEEGVQPNEVTFVCLLSGCSHEGLVDEGMWCYASLATEYTISANSEHYTCMVDLLGRAGHLQEAENMAMAMPCQPHVGAWMALLSACRMHGNVEMAEHVAKQILELEPDMLLVMCWCQTSMLLLATGTSVRMLHSRERKKV